MKTFTCAVAASFVLLFAVPGAISAASPSSDTTYHLTTVSWVNSVQNDVNQDDRYVTLIGRVTGREGDDTYYFNDGTGMIRLDSAKFELPVGQKIIVGGRIDQAYLGIGHLEIDVRQWQFARHH